MGMYISSDPIGLAGNNPTRYAYVQDVNSWMDVFGLYSDLQLSGMGHHLMPRSIAKKLGIEEFSHNNSISWYPYDPSDTASLHAKLHSNLIEAGIPYHGSQFTGTVDDFFEKAAKAYQGINVKGGLKIPGQKDFIFENLTPGEALDKLRELYNKCCKK